MVNALNPEANTALYSHYNVTDHFEVDGNLYQRQGAAWPVRVLTVNGRVASSKFWPVSGSIERYNTWEEIYEHYNETLDASENAGDNGSGPTRTDGNDLTNTENEPG